MGESILRLPAVLARMPIGRSALHERFIKTGRLRKIQLGPRSIGFAESNVDEVVAEIIAESGKVKALPMVPNEPQRRAARKKKQTKRARR